MVFNASSSAYGGSWKVRILPTCQRPPLADLVASLRPAWIREPAGAFDAQLSAFGRRIEVRERNTFVCAPLADIEASNTNGRVDATIEASMCGINLFHVRISGLGYLFNTDFHGNFSCVNFRS